MTDGSRAAAPRHRRERAKARGSGLSAVALLLLLVVVATAVVVARQGSSSLPSNDCARSTILVPRCGVLWGAYEHPGPGQSLVSAQTDLESAVGRRFDISYHYHDFTGLSTAVNGAIPDDAERRLAASGRIVFDDWDTQVFSDKTRIQWSAVADGEYDRSVIIPVARSIKAFGRPMMLSIVHEMDSLVGQSGTPADYVAMYRHIHQVFAAQGVSNVVWVWTTTGYLGNESLFDSLYPGDAYVDWVGYDPYNFGTCHTGSGTYKSFDATIDPMYRWLQDHGYGDKPFILPEYGTVASASHPVATSEWYASVPAGLASHPDIKAAVQWDDATGACDTRLTSDAGEQTAFARAGRSHQVLGTNGR